MSYRFFTQYKLAAGVVAMIAPSMASAYVGPGAGITAIGSVLALLVGVVLAIVGFLWYPIKRFIRSRSGKASSDNLTQENTAEETGNREEK